LTTGDGFFEFGWCKFSYDETVAEWIHHSIDAARDCVSDTQNAHWFRYQNTWFAGVNVLGNDKRGAVPGGIALGGKAIEFIGENLGLTDIEWDAAQVSVIYPGYPKPSDKESEAAFHYRLHRDAAHVDGIQHKGVQRRRFLGETHAFVLGVPMVETSPGAGPLVVWQGSHEIVRRTFVEAFGDIPSEQWSTVDVTEIYQAMRRRIFQSCPRIEVWTRPGETYLIHRLSLHGMAGWPNEEAHSLDGRTLDGRMICYFRPNILSPQQWLFRQ